MSTVNLENKRQLIDSIKNMSVIELAQLVKELEQEFGVSAAAPVAVAATSEASASGTGSAGAAKTEYTVKLTGLKPDAKKVDVIKAVARLKNIKVMEAKNLIDDCANAPQIILSDVNQSKAKETEAELSGVGATIEIS